jgi:polar amino acid transport system substrate-binding protein
MGTSMFRDRSAGLRTTTVCATLLFLSLSLAQPQLPQHWFQERGPASDQDAISFCVDPRDPGHMVDAAIAEAIAAGLLVNVRLHVVESAFFQDDFDDLFFELMEHCTAYVGFRLYADTYPDWLTVTRSFYEARFVLVTTEPDWHQLSDVPVEVPIGVVQGSMGDVRFLMANNALPASQRRPRQPLGRPPLAFDALMDGRVSVLLVWEPWWWWLAQERPELNDLHVVAAPFISEPAIGVGAVLLAGRTFARASIDDAVAALRDDGTIEGIIEEFAYPATVP